MQACNGGAKTAASGTGQQPASKAASVQFYLVSQLGADLSWRLQLAACSCSANLLALKVRIAPFKGCPGLPAKVASQHAAKHSSQLRAL